MVAVAPYENAHVEELTDQVAWAHEARREGNNVAEFVVPTDRAYEAPSEKPPMLHCWGLIVYRSNTLCRALSMTWTSGP